MKFSSSYSRCLRRLETDAAADEPGSLSQRLQTVIDGLEGERISVCEIRDHFGSDAATMLTAFLTLVFLVPVSIPGVSTVFGGAILLLAIGRIGGRPLWLPARIAQRSLPAARLRAALTRGLRPFERLERLSRPQRLATFTSGATARRINDGGVVLGAALLMAPFGMIPLTNTLPAAALLLLAIGALQRDGLSVLLGHTANVVTIAYFAALVGGGVALQKMLQQFLQ